MNDAEIERFYDARDVRTIAYGVDRRALTSAVGLIAGRSALSRPGQVALLALANMAARTQRQLAVVLPDVPLLAHALRPATTLAESIAATLLAINPALILTINGVRIDRHDTALNAEAHAVTVGIGDDVAGADVYLGWKGGRGELDLKPTTTGDRDDEVVGAATAACLGAAAIFHLSHGRAASPAQVNLVERQALSRSATSPGPAEEIGTASITGPIDAGDIAVLGAGALSNALVYWATEIGHIGAWDLVDADVAELSNTSRCMTMTAADAGWEGGSPGGVARDKAQILADLIGGQAVRLWYDEWLELDPSRADLVLPLANERGVRAAVASRGEPLLVHAATSAQWTAELHLHRPDVDDCPACRIPVTTTPRFECSTAPAEIVAEGTGSGDSALPFLSAAAGLMLAIALTQIRLDADLIAGRHNHWRLCFEPAVALRASVHPQGGCPHTLSRDARRLIQQADPRLHDPLDLPIWAQD